MHLHFSGAVENVDLEAQTVSFSRGPFVPAVTLKFEHLVLAIGSVVDVSRVPGMPEHGYLMKTVGDASRLPVDLIQRLEEASLRLDLQEALALAGEGVVKATVQTEQLEDINRVFERIRADSEDVIIRRLRGLHRFN